MYVTLQSLLHKSFRCISAQQCNLILRIAGCSLTLQGSYTKLASLIKWLTSNTSYQRGSLLTCHGWTMSGRLVLQRRVVLLNTRSISEGEEPAFCDQQPCHVLNDYLIRKLFTCSDSHGGIHHWCKHRLQWSYTHSCQQWVWLRGPIPVPSKHRYQSQTSMDYMCLKIPPFPKVVQFTLEPKRLDEKSNLNFHLDHTARATLQHSFYFWLSANCLWFPQHVQ